MYNLLVFLGFFYYLPRLLWKSWKLGYPLLKRLGFESLPAVPLRSKTVFWVHSVSLGETKVANRFIEELKKRYPLSTVFLSTVTLTGFAEAKKGTADHYFYMPIDFSWVMKRYMKTLSPTALFFIEGDLWYNCMKFAKRTKAKVFLISGRMSEKTLNRWLKVPKLACKFFSLLDGVCVQTEEDAASFRKVGVKGSRLLVTGNLKYEARPRFPKQEELSQAKERLGIYPDNLVITCISTHPKEEAILLKQILPLLQELPQLKLILIPRHPERASEVEKECLEKGERVLRWSRKEKEGRIILIDTTGLVPLFIQLSTLALVGGSFIPGIGGHNILEPVFLGSFPIFGPFMESQKELTRFVLQAKAGIQIEAELLGPLLRGLLLHKEKAEALREQGERLANRLGNVIEPTFGFIQKALEIK